jgi:hypothetical protein
MRPDLAPGIADRIASDHAKAVRDASVLRRPRASQAAAQRVAAGSRTVLRLFVVAVFGVAIIALAFSGAGS